jgi:mycofactocin precursor
MAELVTEVLEETQVEEQADEVVLIEEVSIDGMCGVY